MQSRPTLHTNRLILRPFEISDGPRVKELAGDPLIAATTLTVPHPYLDGMAESWISTHQENFEKGWGIQFGMVLKSSNELIGCIDFCSLSQKHKKAEIGYWVGVNFWNQGFASEATRGLVQFGFDELGLNRIMARHAAQNIASGRVMEKAGMIKEGVLRQDVIKDGIFRDSVLYSILRSEYKEAKP